jgi:hypothetical protein
MDPASATETSDQIAASKVNGSAVYNGARERMGSIYDVMIDKRSGQVTYAIMSFGGFLGIGDSYHPLPWPTLKYDTGLGGYLVNIDRETLEGAPYYESDATPDWNDPTYGKKIRDYYGVTPYRNEIPS